ncbi:MAG: hypothetical protein P9M13_07000 [Candidatus Ancaeobacter aquaticus]|nr:hypothetical protein [Candidatus Ancaeobacter aquaticus]
MKQHRIFWLSLSIMLLLGRLGLSPVLAQTDPQQNVETVKASKW